MEGIFRPTLNLGNSIVGVGILAMPYCIEKCGLVLGLVLIAASAVFTIWSLKMLVRSAQLTHKSSYEQLAFHTFGRHGKLVVELSIIGLTIGILISFFIVIGDLTPPIVANLLGITWSPGFLRMFLMTLLAFTVSLPLSLLRNVDSLSWVAISSLVFYSFLLLRVVLMSAPSVLSFEVWRTVSFVKFEGLLHCLPICALALSCQAQMFVIYTQMADPSIRKMSTIINGAIYLVSTGYGLMAFFGYMTFARDGVKGDILTNFAHDGVSQLCRLGFSLSVVVSFPLVVFPIRASIHSLLFARAQLAGGDLHGTEPIPTRIFNTITISIITGTLAIAILVPNVESVLALTGATTGSIISYIVPSLIFLSVVGSHAPFSNRAKFIAVLGVLVMVVGTGTIVSEHMRADDSLSTPDSKHFPRPFVPQGPIAVEDFKQKLPAQEEAPKLPGVNKHNNLLPPNKDDIIKNDVIKDDVMKNKQPEVHIPAAGLQPVVEKRGGGGGEVKEKKEEGEVKNVEQGGVLKEEHEEIKKDMEELKERIKAVEEENKELKDVLELNQIEGVNQIDQPAVNQPENEVEKKSGVEVAAAAVEHPARDDSIVHNNVPHDQGVGPVGGGAKVQAPNVNKLLKEEKQELMKAVVRDEENKVRENGGAGNVDGGVKEEEGGHKREVRGEEAEEKSEKAGKDGDQVTGRELKALKLELIH